MGFYKLLPANKADHSGLVALTVTAGGLSSDKQFMTQRLKA